MRKKRLDPNGSIPLYQQLAEQIRTRIEDGAYAEGMRIDSEADLGDQFSVSRITVRQAIQELENEGFLKRVQGKGTFVAKKRLVQQLIRFSSFTETMRAHGLTPDTRTVEIRQEVPTPRIAESLGIPADEKVLLLVRLRSSDGIPLVVHYSYFPLPLVSGIVDALSSGASIYQVLEEKRGVRATKAKQTIELAYATPFEAQLLEIKPRTPVFLVKALVLDITDCPIEYFKTICRADRTEFAMEITRE